MWYNETILDQLHPIRRSRQHVTVTKRARAHSSVIRERQRQCRIISRSKVLSTVDYTTSHRNPSSQEPKPQQCMHRSTKPFHTHNHWMTPASRFFDKVNSTHNYNHCRQENVDPVIPAQVKTPCVQCKNRLTAGLTFAESAPFMSPRLSGNLGWTNYPIEKLLIKLKAKTLQPTLPHTLP